MNFKRFNASFLRNALPISIVKLKRENLNSHFSSYWAYCFYYCFKSQLMTIVSTTEHGKSYHPVVLYKGRYYDYSHPEGVISLSEILSGEVIIHTTIQSFTKQWNLREDTYQELPIIKIMNISREKIYWEIKYFGRQITENIFQPTFVLKKREDKGTNLET